MRQAPFLIALVLAGAASSAVADPEPATHHFTTRYLAGTGYEVYTGVQGLGWYGCSSGPTLPERVGGVCGIEGPFRDLRIDVRSDDGRAVYFVYKFQDADYDDCGPIPHWERNTVEVPEVPADCVRLDVHIGAGAVKGTIDVSWNG